MAFFLIISEGEAGRTMPLLATQDSRIIRLVVDELEKRLQPAKKGREKLQFEMSKKPQPTTGAEE